MKVKSRSEDNKSNRKEGVVWLVKAGNSRKQHIEAFAQPSNTMAAQ